MQIIIFYVKIFMVIEMSTKVLCIMDGVGINDNIYGNAVAMAKKPNLDYLIENYPHSKLEASGELVGLPAGQMGNHGQSPSGAFF